MPTDKIIDKIKKAILEAVEKDVSVWSDAMEVKYPEWKGSRILKRSGNQYQRKLVFGYDNEQVDELEAGTPAEQIRGIYIQQVRSHERKLGQSNVPLGKLPKRNKVNVKAHNRKYKNYKPIQLTSGDWIMVSKIPKRKGTKPVSRSAKKRYTKKYMVKLIAAALKQEFS